MSDHHHGDASNERDPLEEFLKKMQEQGFDPSAGATGQGGKGASSNAVSYTHLTLPTIRLV